MTMLILALVVAGLITGVILWRRPDARAVAAGAWKAGASQAATEFRNGYKATRDAYDRAQKVLRARGTKRARFLAGTLELLGVTAVAAGGALYGTAKTIGATRRVLVEAVRGGRAAYATWELEAIEVEVVPDVPVDADDIEATVVHDDPTYVVPSAEPSTTGLITDTVVIASAVCDRCGGTHGLMLKSGQDKAVVHCQCGQEIHVFRTSNTQAKPQAGILDLEGTDMAVAQEATGLTSYSLAHEQIARELNALSATSNSLVASMGGLLAQHSHLVGNAAVLQDLINQAAAVAAQIAKDAAAVATA